jgi:hypothetical protein
MFFRMEQCFKIVFSIYKGYILGLRGQITTTDTVYTCQVYHADFSERRFRFYTGHRFITTVFKNISTNHKNM